MPQPTLIALLLRPLLVLLRLARRHLLLAPLLLLLLHRHHLFIHLHRILPHRHRVRLRHLYRLWLQLSRRPRLQGIARARARQLEAHAQAGGLGPDALLGLNRVGVEEVGGREDRAGDGVGLGGDEGGEGGGVGEDRGWGAEGEGEGERDGAGGWGGEWDRG